MKVINPVILIILALALLGCGEYQDAVQLDKNYIALGNASNWIEDERDCPLPSDSLGTIADIHNYYRDNWTWVIDEGEHWQSSCYSRAVMHGDCEDYAGAILSELERAGYQDIGIAYLLLDNGNYHAMAYAIEDGRIYMMDYSHTEKVGTAPVWDYIHGIQFFYDRYEIWDR